MAQADIDYPFRLIKTNGVTLNVAQAGPDDGPLVILLHGFPEFWYGWRHQIPFLAAQGFRVWAPDQRGYNLSDKPRGVMAYARDELARDVIGLMQAAGVDQARVVGHDWGALVAWWLANHHPQRVEKLAILNVPHHNVAVQTIRRSPSQLARSWYAFAFQMPGVPEMMLRANNFALGISALKSTSRKGAFTEADLEDYREAWSKPGALTAMIHWYRALRHTATLVDDPRIHPPTLMIWGAKDAFLSREMAQPSIDLCDDGRLVMIENATHWVQHEEAERVNALLGEFLR